MAQVAKIREEIRDIATRYKRRVKLKNRVAALKQQDDNFADLEKKVLASLRASFVLSTGRCGTMYLTKLLEQAKAELDIYHKPTPEFFNLNNELYHSAADIDCLSRVFKYARFDAFKEAYQLGHHYIETSCKTTFFAPAIDKLMPQCRFLHIVRHPEEFVRSAMARGYYNSNYANQSRIFPRDINTWESYNLVEKNYWNWLATNQFIENFKQNTSKDTFTLKAEDMFSNDEVRESSIDFLSFGVARPKLGENIGKVNVGATKSKLQLKIVNEELRTKIIEMARFYGYSTGNI